MRRVFILFLLVLTVCAVMYAQQSTSTTSSVVPRLIRFSGTLVDNSYKPVSGTVGVVFSIYTQQRGGAPLWTEIQNVRPDAQGKYNILLGATKADGIPMELFTSGEAQWLGVRLEGQAEQPRVLLVSVPYALKAAEAETLAGRPLSAFVLSGTPRSRLRYPCDAARAPSSRRGNARPILRSRRNP